MGVKRKRRWQMDVKANGCQGKWLLREREVGVKGSGCEDKYT